MRKIWRALITFVFAIFGFLSMYVVWHCRDWLEINTALYPIHPITTGGCMDMENCSNWVLIFMSILIFLPVIVFAAAAFFFSKRQRSILQWIALLFGLMAAHTAVVLVPY